MWNRSSKGTERDGKAAVDITNCISCLTWAKSSVEHLLWTATAKPSTALQRPGAQCYSWANCRSPLVNQEATILDVPEVWCKFCKFFCFELLRKRTFFCWFAVFQLIFLPQPSDERVIDSCESAYCDMIWLMCDLARDHVTTLEWKCLQQVLGFFAIASC